MIVLNYKAKKLIRKIVSSPARKIFLILLAAVILLLIPVLGSSGLPPEEPGPFTFADGIYEGASDYYD